MLNYLFSVSFTFGTFEDPRLLLNYRFRLSFQGDDDYPSQMTAIECIICFE